MAALTQFRPTIWSSKLIVDVDQAMVFANLANRDYQGEITGKGNIVKINEIGDVTVNDYTENLDITVQTLTGAQKELVIDQQKYFAFSVDDVLAAQANVNVMGGAMQKAAFSIAKTVDKHLAGKYTEAGVPTSGIGTSGTSLSLYAVHATTAASGLLGVFSAMNRYANEADMPNQGRWFVVPPWLASYITYAGMVDNWSGAAKFGDPVNKGTGYIGSVMGWDIYSSNNVSSDGTQYRCMFGVKSAISFAGQITRVESGRIEKQFGDQVKGLYVYGSKVVRPDHLGVAYLAIGGLST